MFSQKPFYKILFPLEDQHHNIKKSLKIIIYLNRDQRKHQTTEAVCVKHSFTNILNQRQNDYGV